MKRSLLLPTLIIFLIGATISEINAQPQFELSQNIYRIPYENGKLMQVSQDHFTHNPLGRYDLKAQGTNNCNSHFVVAAAAGIVRRVVENNNQSCPDCGSSNNYVWIEHANGEWTKYTHLAENSVPVAVNDAVCAGTILGYECWVGATSPAENRHLHFEVRRPNDPANPVIDPAGGFMNPLDGAHLIPVFNTISKHYFEKDDSWAASGSVSCLNTSIEMPVQTIGNDAISIYMVSDIIRTGTNTVIYSNGSNGMLQAGVSITLSPGFNATSGSFFQARIGNCATTVFPGTICFY